MCICDLKLAIQWFIQQFTGEQLRFSNAQQPARNRHHFYCIEMTYLSNTCHPRPTNDIKRLHWTVKLFKSSAVELNWFTQCQETRTSSDSLEPNVELTELQHPLSNRSSSRGWSVRCCQGCRSAFWGLRFQRHRPPLTTCSSLIQRCARPPSYSSSKGYVSGQIKPKRHFNLLNRVCRFSYLAS